MRVEVPSETKPWHSEELQGLIQQRRLCGNSSDRSILSKRIQKLTRAILRKHKNSKISKILQEFTGLERLPKTQDYPVERKLNDAEIHCDIFDKTLEQIYESPDEILSVDYEKIKRIPSFDLSEMRWALGKWGILVVRISRTSLSK